MVDTSPAGPAEGTFRLIYRSRNRILADRRRSELGALFSAARSNNKAHGLCGALLVSGDWFCQVLEGQEAVVRSLFERIERDTRHDRIAVLQSQTVAEPVFSRWAMAKVATDGEPDIPLIAHLEGIASAAPRATTPEQEAVLDTMRQAVREDSSTA